MIITCIPQSDIQMNFLQLNLQTAADNLFIDGTRIIYKTMQSISMHTLCRIACPQVLYSTQCRYAQCLLPGTQGHCQLYRRIVIHQASW